MPPTFHSYPSLCQHLYTHLPQVAPSHSLLGSLPAHLHLHRTLQLPAPATKCCSPSSTSKPSPYRFQSTCMIRLQLPTPELLDKLPPPDPTLVCCAFKRQRLYLFR